MATIDNQSEHLSSKVQTVVENMKKAEAETLVCRSRGYVSHLDSSCNQWTVTYCVCIYELPGCVHYKNVLFGKFEILSKSIRQCRKVQHNYAEYTCNVYSSDDENRFEWNHSHQICSEESFNYSLFMLSKLQNHLITIHAHSHTSQWTLISQAQAGKSWREKELKLRGMRPFS